jgi:hypothetical protein
MSCANCENYPRHTIRKVGKKVLAPKSNLGEYTSNKSTIIPNECIVHSKVQTNKTQINTNIDKEQLKLHNVKGLVEKYKVE